MLDPDTRLKERYRILRRVGGGGFGHVYKAIDEVFGCSVAIKETREEISGEEKLRKAFEREARLLRNLKHESLPRVTDYFFQDQSQFLVMDFVEGEDLAARLRKRLMNDQGPFTCRELLPWAEKILAALEYLHGRPEPIIHRDIKPSNIKLTDDGEVYLLDFGLAKGVAGQMSTIIDGQPTSSVLGFTREYAPLEQLQGTGTEPQSDIYALGATLYHLLTGRLPTPAPQRDEALQIGKDDPLRPADEVNLAILPEVARVISHAMAVRWWDRLGSAKEMRAALRRACESLADTRPEALAHAGSHSSPPASEDKVSTLRLEPPSGAAASPNGEEPSRPAEANANRRGLRGLWLGGGLALLLLAGIVVAVRFELPRWPTQTASTEHGTKGVQPTATPTPPAGGEPVKLSIKKVLSDHTGDPKKPVWSVAFSRDGSLAAGASEDSTIVLWDTRTWRPKFPPLSGHKGAVYSVAFSPDGKILASGGQDSTVRLWDMQKGRPIDTLRREDNKAVLRLAFSPDGDLLAGCSGDHPNEGCEEIRLWDVHNGWKPRALAKQERRVFAIAFSPDSNTLVSTGAEDEQLRLWGISLWDVKGDGGRVKLKDYDSALSTLAFSSDGKYMACGSGDTTVKIWLYKPLSTPKWVELAPTEAHNSLVTSIAFSPDNRTLASATSDARIRLWDVSSQTPNLLWTSQAEIQASQWSIAFSPDGQMLLTGGEDNLVRVWQ